MSSHLSTRIDLLVLLIAHGLAAAGCAKAPEPSRDGSPVYEGRAYEHYDQLFRAQLSSTAPAIQEQELVCEVGRLADRFSMDTVEKKLRRLRTRILDSAGPEAERRRARGIQLRDYEGAGPICDSLRRKADSLHPLPPAH